MDYNDMHKQDHDRIIHMLDCTDKVIRLEKDILLLQEKIKEMKADREKSEEYRRSDRDKQNRFMMWAGGIVFTVVFMIAGAAIDQNATVKVLQEKVMELKNQVNNLKEAAHEHVE